MGRGSTGGCAMTPLWSILVCGVPDRMMMAAGLLDRLIAQAAYKPIEVLYLLDNYQRSVGAKRNALMAVAQGVYISFVDDDDVVSEQYVHQILPTLQHHGPDVVTFGQLATIQPGGFVHHCVYDLALVRRNPRRMLVARDEAGQPTVHADWSGPPAHTIVWRREVVKGLRFPETNFGEDAAWCDDASLLARTQVNLTDVLYFYRFDQKV